MIRKGVLILLGFLAAVPVRAGVIPGRWEKVDSQTAGTRLTITMKSGERIVDAALSGSDSAILTVHESGGGERRIVKQDVARVETSFVVPDPVSDGIAIGTASGLGLGIFSALIGDQPNGGGKAAGVAGKAAGVLLTAGLGAWIGYAIDKKVQGPEVLYRHR